MRIEEIDVRGFGCLRNVVVPFHPQVTVIVGENESGKSTLHRVIRAALYGIDAGGQGRSVERSDWTRWAPWTPGPYGFAVTVASDSGRRLRVAARLDHRDQTVQVFEVGGGDISAEMRNGRHLAPGLQLLGIDETVFCATAWLGEDGLRLGAPDTAAQRVHNLQEAVERLADSGQGTTAAEATARLRAALDRVGSEKRSQSPLGVATTRLRQLDDELERARRLGERYAADQARLSELEDAAESARRHQLECERAWLVGRLAALGAQRIELQRAAAETTELTSTLDATAAAADFPAHDEAAVLALVGEWRQSRAAASEVEARWLAALPALESTSRRRTAIASGIAALGEVPGIDAATARERATLGADLEAARAELRRLDDSAGIDARTDALRREIAATGLGSIRIGALDTVTGLIAAARRRKRGWVPPILATACAGVAVAATIGLGLMQKTSLIGPVAIAGLLLSALVLGVGRLRGGGSAQARRQLVRLCPDLDVSEAGLNRAAERLPALSALHDDLLHQEVRAASRREEVATASARLHTVTKWIERLAGDLAVVDGADLAGDEPGDRAHELLGRIDALAAASARSDELRVEDNGLAQTEAALRLLGDEAALARDAFIAVEARLRSRLGTHEPDADIELLVRAFTEACEMRRRHDLTAAQLASLRPRLRGHDGDGQLADMAARLSRDLLSRGGNPADAATAFPLNQTALDRLEREVDVARHRADGITMRAAQLHSRLTAAFDGLPVLVDLEDEHAICQSARDRALHQRAALTRAIELVEASARAVHRDLAPRLAATISARLSELTDARYDAVNVDTDHFAIALHGRERPDLIPLEQVSHGTRDQVSLLLRLALAEVLSDSGESVPLLLDEPLLSSDPQRRGLAIDFLCALSERHQIMITTSDQAIADAVVKRLGSAASVTTLASPAPALSVDGVLVDMPKLRRAHR